MKANIIITAILLFIFSFNSNSQIKMYNNGNALLGEMIPYAQDLHGELSLQILGPGEIGSLAKIALGDYGRMETGSRNIMISEYGDYDSDQLWLHGKNGVYFTRGNSTSIIAKYDVSEGNKFVFNCPVFATSFTSTSDERFKSNVKDLDSSLVKLNKLSGVSYNYTFPNRFGKSSSSNSDSRNTTGELTEKEKKDKEFFERFEKESLNPKGKHLGFIAQDLKNVFPELVQQDSAGYFYVDYIGLIPVIIEALKEQQSMISAQSLKIKELEKLIEASKSEDTKDKSLKSATIADSSKIKDTNKSTNAFLYQNTPNPFTYDTKIKYFIPETTANAVIYIFNLQGTLLKSNNIESTGFGEITINGSDLTPGMYIYSLLVDGAEVDTKRMILSE
ncbi:MAG: tail fiber domain-containing protein [Bacteroidales bacterium]|nr:tail fiber domain-containing protein [Bacteroidales bacterium]